MPNDKVVDGLVHRTLKRLIIMAGTGDGYRLTGLTEEVRGGFESRRRPVGCSSDKKMWMTPFQQHCARAGQEWFGRRKFWVHF